MNQRLAALWRVRLADFAASFLPVAKWCELQGVSRSGVTYWKRKLASERRDAATDPHDGRWLSVREEETRPQRTIPGALGRGITLRLGSATIEVQPGFDPAHLRAVVCALEGKSC